MRGSAGDDLKLSAVCELPETPRQVTAKPVTKNMTRLTEKITVHTRQRRKLRIVLCAEHLFFGELDQTYRQRRDRLLRRHAGTVELGICS